MKRNRWKRVLSLGLVCALTAGLCACGNGGKTKNAALAKENVYKVQEIAMPDMGGDDYNVYASAHRDGYVYLMAEVYHWDSSDATTDIRVVSIKDDGTDVQMSQLEIPEWESRIDSDAVSNTEPEGGEAVPYSGMRTSSEEDLNTGDGENPEEAAEGDGNSEGEPQPESEREGDTGGEAQPEPEGEEGTGGETETGDDPEGAEEPAGEGDAEGTEDIDTSMAVEPDMPVDTWENSNYNNYIFGADGRIYAIRYYSYSDYANDTYIDKNYIASWNSDGSFQWEKELEGIRSEEEYVYINVMTASPDGSVTILLSGDNAYRLTVDAQGNIGPKEPLSEDTGKVFNNFDRVIDKGDGTFFVLYYDENDWTKEYIATYDPATDTLGQPAPLPSNFGYNGYNNMSVGLNSDLVCSNGDGIFTYKIGDEALAQKMNFINSDLCIGNISSLVELDGNTFLAVYYENYEDGMKAGLFNYVKPEDIPDKAVLVLAGSYVDGDVERRVIEFNRNSEEYRIVVKSYDSFNTYDDWQAGYTQLNNDVTTGNMPDILITDGLPVENYVAKGLLEDIGKMIEEDEELSQVEYVQNVFDAYSVDGKLYYVIPCFTVSTMIGKESIVGDRTSWTMADMLELKASLPEDTHMMGELTRQGFFSTMMQYCGSDFVDVDTGKCDFDTQNFITMMEFAKELPEELSEDYYGEDYWATYESQYRDGRTILSGMSIGTIRDTNYMINGYFGGDVAFIGFPTENGSGSYVSATESYAISSKSRNKEGAWEFLRYYLTDEYQSEISWGMPVQRKQFDEMAGKGTERPYYLNEDGTKEEYDDYFYMNGEEIKLDPLSQEQVERIVGFILSVDKCYYYNESIMNIINEEMDAFYTGQKTAQEVAKTIQNRAQLYVDENR